jgi:hypothetical protein
MAHNKILVVDGYFLVFPLDRDTTESSGKARILLIAHDRLHHKSMTAHEFLVD